MRRFYLIKTATKIASMHLLFPQDVWTAMHNDKELVSKYMKPLLVGEVQGEEVRFVLCIFFFSDNISSFYRSKGQHYGRLDNFCDYTVLALLALLASL